MRIALLEADVALPVAKDFIKQVKERAIGQEVIKSVSPAQMVIKIVQDCLEETLGGEEAAELNLAANPPVVVMMVGLELERVLQGLAVLDGQPCGDERLLRQVADYSMPNVSDKVLRIILSYTDYVNRVVWKKY